MPKSEILQLGLGVVFIAATGLLPDLLGSRYWSHNIQLVNIVIAAAVFQNFLMQDADQVSFGQGAIFGTGAYVAAMAVVYGGVGWIGAIMIGGLAAAGGGLLFALPALRVQGYYLGFVTLGAAMVFPELLFVLDRYTNGINGITVDTKSWHVVLAFGATPLTLATIAVAASALVFHVMIRHSSLGRRIKIAGASPEAAQTLGIRPGAIRALVFLLACTGTGLAGALYTPIIGFAAPVAFNLELSILLFLAVIVGGKGQILGPVTGVYLLYLLPNVLLVDLVDYRLLAYGVLALLVMLAFPDGIVGTVLRRLHREPAVDGSHLNPSAFPIPLAAVDGRAAAGESVITVRDASKSFGAVAALAEVDLDVERGTIVGLIGGNGSGKTTLINAITGFNRLSRGRVDIAGQNNRSLSSAEIASQGIARTFQTPRIFESLSAWENVLIGSENPLGARPTNAGPVLDVLERQLADCGTDTIPHGQRRSMEVLRVILTGADVLLLDEPAAGLSTDERKALSSLLVRLRDEGGKTILLVEHDLDLVWSIADKIAVMESGRLVACGSPAEIVEAPAVRKLFVRFAHA